MLSEVARREVSSKGVECSVNSKIEDSEVEGSEIVDSE